MKTVENTRKGSNPFRLNESSNEAQLCSYSGCDNYKTEILAMITMTSCLSFFTARQRSCGKVMFSLVSVCSGAPRVTITRDALNFTVQPQAQMSTDVAPHVNLGDPLHAGEEAHKQRDPLWL